MVSPSCRVIMDAQTLQYLKASVTKSISGRLQEICTAYEAYEYLKKQFGNGLLQDFVLLHDKFTRLRFQPGFDPQRFVADFEDLIKEYESIGTKFSDEYLTTIFLQKIDGIYNHDSPFSTFFSTVSSVPDEHQTLEYVKKRFTNIA